MFNLWPLASLVCAYALGFAGGPLVRRIKRDSPRWQARSEDQRRFLGFLPGAVLGIVVGVVLILLFDQ